MRVLTLVLWLLTAGVAAAETLTFEVYELKSDGTRQLLAKGTRQYSVDDLEVTRFNIGESFALKALKITDDFNVGASVHREKELVGFGLWVRQRVKWYEFWKNDGFSWDWFNRERPPVYRKLQGQGRVNATTIKGPGYEELTRVEFLDDVTLRFQASRWIFFFSDRDTHHVVVRKGSVLQLAP